MQFTSRHIEFLTGDGTVEAQIAALLLVQLYSCCIDLISEKLTVIVILSRWKWGNLVKNRGIFYRV